LRSQANSLGQAIKNANDGVGIIQTADKAMDEQVKILDTIKTKATQAAQDGQTEKSRKALQQDITKLMEEMDNIAQTTSFNGQSLLSGQYTDKKFQIGAYSNETITVNIGATSSDKIGHTRFETGDIISAAENVALKFIDVDGLHDVQLESVKISTSAGTGLGVLVETINKSSDKTGIKASWNVKTTGMTEVHSGSIKGLSINGIAIGNIEDIKANDKDGKLVQAINALTDKHGIIASMDARGRLELTSTDGRGMRISAQGFGTGSDVSSVNSSITMSSVAGIGSVLTPNTHRFENYGKLTLIRNDGKDIIVSGTTDDFVGGNGGLDFAGFGTLVGGEKIETEATINLRDIKNGFSLIEGEAIGAFNDQNSQLYSQASVIGTVMTQAGVGLGVGVTTLEGAMATMAIAESSIKDLDKIRSDLGSTQNQLITTINNISVTQVNVKAAESQIRDVDFAEESANFQKNNILAQAGSYAMSQANQQAQAVQKFLQ
jgi:flagellin